MNRLGALIAAFAGCSLKAVARILALSLLAQVEANFVGAAEAAYAADRFENAHQAWLEGARDWSRYIQWNDGLALPMGARMYFSGYVTGFAEYANKICAFPAGTTFDQIKWAVSNYVNAHPGRWNEPEDILTTMAIDEAWPAEHEYKTNQCARRAK